MTSKIGPHLIIGRRDGFGEFLEQTQGKLAIVKCLDDFGPAQEAKDIDPNVLTVGRVNTAKHFSTGQRVDMQMWEPRGDYKGPEGAKRAASHYYKTVKPIWDLNPQIDVWETFNEGSSFWDWQSMFFIAMMDEVEDRFRLAHYACSSGNPPSIDVAAQMMPCLIEAKKRDHYLSLHQYGGVGTDIQTLKGTEPWHALRHRWLYDFWRKDNADPMLIISEFGQAGGFDSLDWSILGPDFEWYDNQLAEDEYVKGAALFTLGDWYQSNYYKKLPLFGHHIATFVPEATPPPDPPDPPDPPAVREYARRVVLIPSETTEIEDAEIANRYARTVTVIRSADDAFVLPGAEWPTQLKRLTVEVWDVMRVAHENNIEDAKEALDNFIDTFHPIRETDTDFTLKYFEFSGTEPPKPEPFRLVWPTDFMVYTQRFGERPEYYKQFGLPGHEGVDIRCPVGGRVYAAASGEVYWVGWRRADHPYGYSIKIRHEHGDDTFKTIYAHLKDDSATVGVGDWVGAGQLIGLGDTTGNTDASHLHLTLIKAGATASGETDYPRDIVNPEHYLPDIDGVPPPPPPPPEPTHKPLAMLHLKAESGGTITDEAWQIDMEMLKDAAMDGAKWTTNNQVESIAWVRNSTGLKTENMIARLYSAGDNPSLTNAELWFGEQYEWIDWAQAASMLIEIHNEPNLLKEWPRDESNFARWFADVAIMIHARWPNARVGFPGLSPQPNTQAFYEACYDAILTHADWIGAHCYFSADGSEAFGIDNDSADQAGGLYWQRLIDWIPPNIPIWITEFADNGDGPDIDRARRTAEYFGKQYPLRIRGLACYISQDTNFPKQEWVSNPYMVGEVEKVLGQRG